jgi:hypothetical protein
MVPNVGPNRYGPRMAEWVGSNGFRLFPEDDPHTAPATALLVPSAGGRLTLLTYTWTHPTDGPQEGVFAFGSAQDAADALFCDTWHQSSPQTMTRAAHEPAWFQCAYGDGWHWQIAVTVTEDELTLLMRNVIPDGSRRPAGPYETMVMKLVAAGTDRG